MPANKKNGTKKKIPDKIKFKYIFDDDYGPTFVNGVIGGITSTGQIAMNFYLERAPIPYSHLHKLSDKGIGALIETVPDKNYAMLIRKIDTGILLNYTEAKKIHEWLGRHIKLFEESFEIKSV